MDKKLADLFMSFPKGPKFPYQITLTRVNTGSTLQYVRWLPDDRIEWSLKCTEQMSAVKGWNFHAERIEKNIAYQFEQNEIDWYLYMCQGTPFYITK